MAREADGNGVLMEGRLWCDGLLGRWVMEWKRYFTAALKLRQASLIEDRAY